MIEEKLKAEINGLINEYPSHRPALIMALHAVMHDHGSISKTDIIGLAEIFNEHPAEIQSVATFYTMFRFEPSGKCRIEICTNVSCMLAGSNEIAGHLKKKLGIEFGETTDDGLFTIEEVECLAACDLAPVIAVNGEFVGPVTVNKVDEIIDQWRMANKF
ncbi:MAG: NAD(P)H-dependent oxidoreductase subunit E [bacterium]